MDPSDKKEPENWGASHCTLRDFEIGTSFWTYCYNFHYGEYSESNKNIEKPTKPIMSGGLYEGYGNRRILKAIYKMGIF